LSKGKKEVEQGAGNREQEEGSWAGSRKLRTGRRRLSRMQEIE
jgi:hypothetical protein